MKRSILDQPSKILEWEDYMLENDKKQHASFFDAMKSQVRNYKEKVGGQAAQILTRNFSQDCIKEYYDKNAGKMARRKVQVKKTEIRHRLEKRLFLP